MTDYSWAAVERRTREWLDASLRDGVRRGYDRREGVFEADGRPRRLDCYHFQLLQRKLKVFRLLDGIAPGSFLDAGAGFEDYPRLVRERYGAAAFYADFNHHANLPLDGTASDRLDCAVTASLARLPFPDASIDVVLCSEVLEHLVRPVEAIAELRRIARKAVIVTSLEALAPRWWQRLWAHYRVDVSIPHIERNFLSLPELQALFGDDAHYESLLDSTTLPVPMASAPAEQDAAYAGLRDLDALVEALRVASAATDPLGPHAAGILVATGLRDPGRGVASPERVRELARWLTVRTAALEQERFEGMNRNAFVAVTLKRYAPGLSEDAMVARLLSYTAPQRDRPVSPDLLRRLCCPDCRAPLQPSAPGVRCDACAVEFPADYGVPLLYPTRLPADGALDEDSIRRLGGRRPWLVRRVMRRLRRNEQPAGRLRRAVWALAERRRSATTS
jgi:ubiquinone/menaquinone biosynthesis C-methylase UbiE